MRTALSITCLCVLTGVALAQPDPAPLPVAPAEPPATAPEPSYVPPPAPDKPGAPAFLSVTLSPVHLVFPIGEVTIELRPTTNVGVAVIAGAGRIANEDETVTASATEIGGQFSYYFMRDFVGLHAGAELLYMHIGDVDQDSSVTAAGLSTGGYVGWKYLHSSGFTFVAQGGVSYLVARAKSSSTQQMAEETKVFPLLNLNFGWSF